VGAKAKDAKGLKLVTQEAQDARRRFDELFSRTHKKTGAKDADVEALRKHMREHEGEAFWRRIVGPMGAAESFALEHTSGVTPALSERWRQRLNDIRKDLAGENPSEAESLLAQHASLCWLRLAEVELQYTSRLGTQHTLALGVYYEKRLAMAQRRFTRACETLERVRMMRRRATQIRAPAEAERRRA
jgi:hypothetical protein